MKNLTNLTLIVTLAFAASAFADKPKKDNKGKGKDKDKGATAQVAVVKGGNDRDAVRSYFSSRYGAGNCPPGLAKKNNGCLPPGHAKSRYQVGQPLATNVIYIDAPRELVVRLAPLPAGHKYVIVDGDVVKLAVGTRLVVDAISAWF